VPERSLLVTAAAALAVAAALVVTGPSAPPEVDSLDGAVLVIEHTAPAWDCPEEPAAIS
jgi:hypothetical protein